MKPQSIAHMFFEACDNFDKPNAAMVKIEGSYKKFSHKFFRQRVNHFGRGLMGLGVADGDHIAILAETRFEWAIADLGIVCAGGVGIPVYPTLTSDQAAWILDNSEAKGIVVSTLEQAEKVMEAKNRLPKLGFVIMMDDGEAPEGCLKMSDVETKGSREDNENEFEKRWKSIEPEKLLTIIYTSGTTGNPKGVMLTHANLVSNVLACEPFMPYTPSDIHLSHLPLSHVLERMGGYYCMIFRGVTIAYAEDIKTVADNIREVRPTVLISVPRLYEKIYAKIMAGVESGSFIKKAIFNWASKVGAKALTYFNEDQPLPGLLAHKWAIADKLVFSKVKVATGGRLKYLVSGGAPLAREIAEFFLGMGLKMLEGYGLTETSPVLTFNRPNKNKPGTVGPAIPGVEIKIADDGEILTRGPNLMTGYFKNPEATEEVIVDGWFHTGDIGVLDEDGYLKITDRKKDLIVTSGGKNIAPQPMESALKLSGLIEQAVVIGDKRNFITALLVPPWETVNDWAPARGWSKDPEALVKDEGFLKAIGEEVERQLKGFAHYEKVKKFSVIPKLLSIEDGELTPSMKVKRRVVNEKFKALIDGMYS